ncbi:catechol 2,3-dioxygenase-like lactoylglutathione lyase family enzyme [Hamadaea flava]|uniref:VOC family protein n=1 Tax=Hamadaea flava TaxID=1742688 RepID=A0ABV8LG54_9ACTN|nr:VOC family protein [Hamadaea flava]MCP2326662.1 catechol 2,3-dioxygenase-like lactoylglutathione lyase family enzyme [Hamadaea flava]
MAIARFKKVTMECRDPERVGAFWADVLGRTWKAYDADSGGVFGPTPRHTIWLTRTAEPKTVKNRVHLDVYALSVAGLEVLGASILLPQGDGRTWTVMADPEGNEFCAFVRDELPEDRVAGLVVDAADPRTAAQWWGDLFGVPVKHSDEGWSAVEEVPDLPMRSISVNPVPEPKTVPNRVRWEISVPAYDELEAAGARPVGPGVYADPEGNEFGVVLRRS